MGKFRFSSMAILIIIVLYYNLGVAAVPPKDIIFLIENSVNMKKGDPGFIVKKTVAGFVKKLSDDTQVGVIVFDSDTNVAAPLTVVSETNLQTILAGLDQINYQGKLANIPDAMKKAIFSIAKNGQADSQRAVILITGGKVATGDKNRDIEKANWLLGKLPKGAARHGIKIYGVAFTPQADFEFIQTLVQKTEGESFKAATAAEIPKVLSRIYKHITGKGTEFEEPAFTAADNAGQEQPVGTLPGTQIDPSPIYITEKPPTQTPVGSGSEEAEPASPPVKHVMKKPGDLKPDPAGRSRSRKFPLPLPIMILLALIIIISVVVIVKRTRQRKAGIPAQTPVHPPEQKQPIKIPAAFMPEALFRDVSGVTGEDTHKIVEKETKIGRKKKINQIVIKADTISRQHAVIQYKDYNFWIIDRNSSNGTFLNGKKVVGEMKLSNGDTISFDVYDFEFILPGIKSTDDDVDKTIFRKSNDLQS